MKLIAKWKRQKIKNGKGKVRRKERIWGDKAKWKKKESRIRKVWERKRKYKTIQEKYYSECKE